MAAQITEAHRNHPGHRAGVCPLRHTVTPAPGSIASRPGYACAYTGGHCLPSAACEAMRAELQTISNRPDKARA